MSRHVALRRQGLLTGTRWPAGINIAGSYSSKNEEAGFDDKDEVTRRKQRELETERTRQQNTLSVWHSKTTITGDSNALGVGERARVETAVANGRSNP